MAGEWFDAATKLVLNKKNNHAVNLMPLVKTARAFDCMSAFARESGLEFIYDALLARLKRGLSTRFALGIDFYQTDPGVLYDLLDLSEEYSSLKLYMGSAESRMVFHPKAYAFEDKNGDSCVFIGSANLTQGGLANNHELSAYLHAKGDDLFKDVSKVLNKLIRSEVVVAASTRLIDEYATLHREYTFQLNLGRKKARLAKPSTVFSLDKLRAILDVMRLEPSEEDPKISEFDAQVRRRVNNREEARLQLDSIATAPKLTKSLFLEHYERLVVDSLWHSGGAASPKGDSGY